MNVVANGAVGARKPLTRPQIAWRAAQDIQDGAYVNLGIGMPTLCAAYVPEGRHVTYQSENGILGFGGAPEEPDYDLINASKAPISLLPGASLMHQADSFATIRGGHLDLAILGAFQVAPNGDLANWSTGEGGVPAVGGAMDLSAGAKAVRAVTTHVAKDGSPKLGDVLKCLRLNSLKIEREVERFRREGCAGREQRNHEEQAA